MYRTVKRQKQLNRMVLPFWDVLPHEKKGLTCRIMIYKESTEMQGKQNVEEVRTCSFRILLRILVSNFLKGLFELRAFCSCRSRRNQNSAYSFVAQNHDKRHHFYPIICQCTCITKQRLHVFVFLMHAPCDACLQKFVQILTKRI